MDWNTVPKGLPTACWLAKLTGAEVKEDAIWSNWESRNDSTRKEGLKHFLDPEQDCEDQGMGIIVFQVSMGYVSF